MKKILLTLTLLTQLHYGATPEQIEQYLMVSNAEEELLAMESQFSAMQNSFSKSTNVSKNKTYDMQMFTLRFKDYLEKYISEDEMAEVLENYKNVVLLQFVSASSASQDRDYNETTSYATALKANPEAGTRIDIIKKISNELYSKEAMLVIFDELMKPLMQNGMSAGKMSDNMLKNAKESYFNTILEAYMDETLFATKGFNMEELEELLKIAKTPAIDYEVKAVFAAMAYALKEFFTSLTSIYDTSKHQPISTTDTQHTK